MTRPTGSYFYHPKKKTAEISEKRWNVWSIIKKVLHKTCMILGAFMLFWIILSAIAVFSLGKKTAAPLPDDMILVLRIENGISETNIEPSLLDPFPFRQPTVRGVINTLEKAADDDRVRGLVVSYQGGGISLAHIQEIRKAISRFKESGKFANIYAPSYMDPMGGMSRYYFASAFDEIWMQPVGMLSIAGPSAEMPFFKKPLDKIGVTAQFKQREEFKGAMESFTNENISEPSKEMLASLIGNLSQQMTSTIAQDRELNTDTLDALVNKGVLTGKEALDGKLIDRLDYADIMVSELRTQHGDNDDDQNIKFTSFERYGAEKDTDSKGKEDVALIYVSGTIVDQTTATGSASGSDIADAVTEAYEDDSIKAIVLRVDSPGGSPSASETIRRSLVKAKEKGKKVIVSMGSVAASGGYWVSTDANKIFASSATLTGSIGVIMGKFEASKLWDNLGVNWDGYQIGDNSGFWSIHRPFDNENNARLNVLIDDVYDSFLTRVAEGRNMSLTDARKIAKGRAWTGEQALNLKLVDSLGGLNDALDETAVMIGLNNKEDLNIIRLPRELSRIERLLEAVNGNVKTAPFMKTIQPLIDHINQLSFMSESNTMAYDPNLEAFR